MNNIIERIKVAYYALTKKEFYFAAIDSRKPGKSNAVCFYNTLDTKDFHPFLETVSEDSMNIINKL